MTANNQHFQVVAKDSIKSVCLTFIEEFPIILALSWAAVSATHSSFFSTLVMWFEDDGVTGSGITMTTQFCMFLLPCLGGCCHNLTVLNIHALTFTLSIITYTYIHCTSSHLYMPQFGILPLPPCPATYWYCCWLFMIEVRAGIDTNN